MPGLFGVKLLLLTTVVGSSACLFAGSAASTSDPVTSLPVYPGVTDPDPLPKASVCRKAMEGDFYIVMGEKADAVVDWYARHLPGFKKYHAVTDHRSQDTFFNSDGTQEVTVTGNPNSTEVFSISYGRFQPGLAEPERASFNTGKQVCR
jgi:hypothetical protein